MPMKRLATDPPISTKTIRSTQYLQNAMPSLTSYTTALSLVALLYYSGFSRLTHGRYTPSFYAHQLDRVPNNAHT